MKKVIVLLVMVIAVTMSSCSYIEDVQAVFGGSYEDGYEEGHDDGYDEGYDDGYDDGYDVGYYAPKKITRPSSGTILYGAETQQSYIRVTASDSRDYVVALKNSRGTTQVAFYVRSGDTVEIGVPANYLYVYFASGNDWYGYGEGLMFGEYTRWSMDEDLQDFTDGGWVYTLEKVEDGNFDDTSIDEDEFFS